MEMPNALVAGMQKMLGSMQPPAWLVREIQNRIVLSLNACVRSTKSILVPARAVKGHKTPAHTTVRWVLMRAQPYARGVFEPTIRSLLGWMKRDTATRKLSMILW